MQPKLPPILSRLMAHGFFCFFFGGDGRVTKLKTIAFDRYVHLVGKARPVQFVPDGSKGIMLPASNKAANKNDPSLT